MNTREWIAAMEYENKPCCDGCGKHFTEDEWDERITPHEVYCANFGKEVDTKECGCDRNFHKECYNEDDDQIDRIDFEEDDSDEGEYEWMEPYDGNPVDFL